MPVRVMSNPAQLMLAGNPGKKRRGTKAQRHAKALQRIHADLQRERASKKERPMAKRRRRKSPAARAARVAKRKAKRSSRRKAMPAGLKAYWAKKRGKASHKPKKARRARRSRKSRLKVKKHRARRRSRRAKVVTVSAGHPVVIRKRRGSRGKLRARRIKSRRGRRSLKVGVNAGGMTFTGGLTHLVSNAKATMHDGLHGFAFAFGGAATSVAGGAFASQVTNGILAKFMPSMLGNPIVSRLLGAVNYYVPGWLLAKYVPGISGKSRRAMLTGTTIAALVEVVSPGSFRNLLQKVPVIGGLMGAAEDQASDLGAYVGYALNGAADHDVGGGYAATYDAGTGEPLQGYVALNDYERVDANAAQNVGVAGGVGEYVYTGG